MSVRAVASLSEFQSIIRQPKLTVVDFFATWCGPCKMIAPQVHKLAETKPNVNFLKVDVDQAGEIAMEYKIRAMPTFKLFRGGNVLESFEGADFNQLKTLIQRHEDAEAASPPKQAIPSDAELQCLSGKELLALMKQHNIPSDGLLEKNELIAAIKKHA